MANRRMFPTVRVTFSGAVLMAESSQLQQQQQQRAASDLLMTHPHHPLAYHHHHLQQQHNNNLHLQHHQIGQQQSRVRYFVMLDVVPVDSKRYRYAYHRSSWLVAGKADPPAPARLYTHPDSPFTPDQLRKQVISFEKVKLTNNEMDKQGQVHYNLHLISCMTELGSKQNNSHEIFRQIPRIILNFDVPSVEASRAESESGTCAERN